MSNLTPATRSFILSGTVAAGTDGSVVNLTEIDTRGFNSMRVMALVGTVTSTGVLNIRAKNSDTSGTYGSGTIDNIASVGGTAAQTVSDRLMILEIFKPRRRFVRLDYQRTVANVVITAIVVELFNALEQPVPQLAAHVSAANIVNSPEPSAV